MFGVRVCPFESMSSVSIGNEHWNSQFSCCFVVLFYASTIECVKNTVWTTFYYRKKRLWPKKIFKIESSLYRGALSLRLVTQFASRNFKRLRDEWCLAYCMMNRNKHRQQHQVNVLTDNVLNWRKWYGICCVICKGSKINWVILYPLKRTSWYIRSA